MKTKVAKEYLHQLRQRYDKADKNEKHAILSELTKTAGYERKYAINLLRRKYQHKEGKVSRPRKVIYTSSDSVVLVP